MLLLNEKRGKLRMTNLINKIVIAIEEDEKALVYTTSDYDRGVLIGEHDALISVLDALEYTHDFTYIDNPD